MSTGEVSKAYVELDATGIHVFPQMKDKSQKLHSKWVKCPKEVNPNPMNHRDE